MRAIPSGVDDIIDISTLTFQLPILINPPAKVLRNTVIHTIIDNIDEVDDSGLDLLRAGGSYTPIFTSYQVVTMDQHKMKFTIDNAGNASAQLLSLSGSSLDSDGNLLDWKNVFKSFGEFRDSVSQIRLVLSNDPSVTSNDIVGNIKLNTNNINLLDITLDSNTIPSNTLTPVSAVINPQINFPGDGTLTASATGDRYLLTQDTPGSNGIWAANAKKHDIIEYDGSNWNIVFDASAATAITYTTNLNTNVQYRFNDNEWLKSIDGDYPVGTWRIELAG